MDSDQTEQTDDDIDLLSTGFKFRRSSPIHLTMLKSSSLLLLLNNLLNMQMLGN